MKVQQIYEIVNTVQTEILGYENVTNEETGAVTQEPVAVLNEDLSNIVDIGNEIFDSNNVDNYVRKLIDQIGKIVFVDRVYSGRAPSILMDSWEFGSILEKITIGLPEADENESWNLQHGETYNQDIFYAPEVSAKFYNSKVTFEVDMSFTEMQVKESFQNANQLNSFLSAVYNAVEKSLTVKIDALIMRTINTLIGKTIDADTTGVIAVNLLSGFNATQTAAIKANEAITNPEFLRYAAYTMGLYVKRLGVINRVFNLGHTDKFTPQDLLHIVMLADFQAGADVYLQSDVFHNQFTALPTAESVPYWQGNGGDYSFESVSTIDIQIKDTDETTGKKTVKQSGILAVMFDRDACGVSNRNQRVTTHYNAKAEFYSNFYKSDGSYFVDYNEQAVVFYVADEETTQQTAAKKTAK